jgi:hypothetical protein
MFEVKSLGSRVPLTAHQTSWLEQKSISILGPGSHSCDQFVLGSASQCVVSERASIGSPVRVANDSISHSASMKQNST